MEIINKFYAVVKENGKTISVNEAKFSSFQAPLSAVCFAENGYPEKFSDFTHLEIEIAGFKEEDYNGKEISYYETPYGAVSGNKREEIILTKAFYIPYVFEAQRNCDLANIFKDYCTMSYERNQDGYYYFKCRAYVWDNEVGFVKLIDVSKFIVYDFVTNDVKFLDYGMYDGKFYKNAMDCAEAHNVKFVSF